MIHYKDLNDYMDYSVLISRMSSTDIWTSATGRLRSAKSPNLRLQDTRTVNLLCQDCEQQFGTYEKYFAETIFIPVLESFTPTVNYDERLLKFIVSLSWRTFVTAPDHGWPSPKVKEEATPTADNWWYFLRAKESLHSGDHHLLMLRLVKDAPMIEGSTVDLNFYFFRAVDATITQNQIGEAAVYTKIPGFAVLSNLTAKPLDFTSRTFVGNSGTIDFLSQEMKKPFLDFLLPPHIEVLRPILQLSHKQQQVIEDAYRKNMDKWQESYYFRPLLPRGCKNALTAALNRTGNSTALHCQPVMRNVAPFKS